MAGLNSSLIKSLVDQACWRNIGVWSHEKTRCEKLENVRHCRNCEVFSEAAKTVFRRESSEVELFERSLDLYHGGDLEQKLGDISVLPFRIGGAWLCVYPSQIIRIARKSSIHRIPHRSTDFVRGLVAVDGAIYTCISLNPVLDTAEQDNPDESSKPVQPGVFSRIMILQMPKKRLAIEVDEVRSVVQFNETDISEVSDDCSSKLKPYVTKQCCFDQFLEESMYMLDMDAIEQLYYKALL